MRLRTLALSWLIENNYVKPEINEDGDYRNN